MLQDITMAFRGFAFGGGVLLPCTTIVDLCVSIFLIGSLQRLTYTNFLEL